MGEVDKAAPSATEDRARRLARILDNKFDSFGELIEGDAIEFAQALLEDIEQAGCRLLFPEQMEHVLRVDDANLHAAFAALLPDATPLPWHTVPGEADVILDAGGSERLWVEGSGVVSEADLAKVTAAICVAVNTCGGFKLIVADQVTP